MAKTIDSHTSEHQRHYPYTDGTVLQLDYYPEDTPSSSSGSSKLKSKSKTNSNGKGSPPGTTLKKPVSLSVRVVKTLSKTFSCVLLVELVSTSRVVSSLSLSHRRSILPKTNTAHNTTHKGKHKLSSSNATHFVLKLCDRRYSRGLRDDYDGGEWSQDVEDAYVRFLGIPEERRPEIRVADDIEGDSWYDEEEEEESSGSDSESDSGSNSRSGSGSESSSTSSRSSSSSHKDDTRTRSKGGNQTTDQKPHRRNMLPSKIANQNWTTGHREAYIQKWCTKLFLQELEVYRALSRVQGSLVPILYGAVCVRDKARLSLGAGQVEGLLIEYKKDSFALRDIPRRVVDRDGTWGEIGRMAVRLVQDVGDLGVLNRDIRLDNILVVPCGSEEGGDEGGSGDEGRNGGEFVRVEIPGMGTPNGSWEVIPSFRELQVQEKNTLDVDDTQLRPQPRPATPASTNTASNTPNTNPKYKVVMIDFGIARLQGEYESDEDFRKARKAQDEEGAVGFVLEQFLMRHSTVNINNGGGGVKPFRFSHSGRLDRPWDEDDEEDI